VLLDKHLKPLRPFVFTLYNGPKWLHGPVSLSQ
jgi:hypothetical protein